MKIHSGNSLQNHKFVLSYEDHSINAVNIHHHATHHPLL